MKKTLLTLVITVMTITSASAQREGLWIAPQMTIGGGNMTGFTAPLIAFESEVSVAFNFGADATFMFHNNMGVGAGLAYGAYAFGGSFYDDADVVYIGAQAVLELPVFFKYVSGTRGGFFVQGGFINQFTLGATQQINIDGEEYAKIDGSDAKQDFRTYSLSPFVYFGGNIRCGNRVQMTVGPQISYQATNNFSSSSQLEGRYFTFALKIGVGIHAYQKKK